MPNVGKESASEEVSKIVEKTLKALTDAKAASVTSGEPGARLFFPNGVELVYFKLAIAKEIEVTVAIAGEKAKYPNGAAMERSFASGSDGAPTST